MSKNKKSWRCFHCDEVFTDRAEAQLHFGTGLLCQPVCQIDPATFREMEMQLARYRDEDTDLHREIRSLETQHHLAIRRSEESGYAKGLRDGRQLSAGVSL